MEDEINSQLCGLSVVAAERYLKSRLAQVISQYNEKAEKYRRECDCNGCAVCCRFAVSEFSYEELKKKAENGDVFASQFISVFVPYESENEDINIFPEYVDLLKSDEGYFVYHCPKLTEANRCSDYDNRPQICRDFPDNPLAFLPKSCGFERWKLKSEALCLKLRAEKEIINYMLGNKE